MIAKNKKDGLTHSFLCLAVVTEARALKGLVGDTLNICTVQMWSFGFYTKALSPLILAAGDKSLSRLTRTVSL